MKLYNYLLALLSAGIVVLMVFFLTGSSTKETEERPHVAAMTRSVPVPEEVEFCGEIIKLDRLDLRERFDREINSFTYLHSTTTLYFKRANRFFPVIESILKANGIPDDLKYLCVIESNLETRALSPAKAAGLWQFMEATGRSYGLEITTDVDERYHVEKSTEAACKYFQEAYNRFGSWVNVAAAYNAGMGRISENLKNQYAESALDLLLVQETSRYVFRIVALKEIFSSPWQYGFLFSEENFYPQVPVKLIEVKEDISDLAFFAKQHDINYMILKDYNVWLRDSKLRTRGKTYEIAVPEKEYLYFDKRKIKIHDPNWVKQ
jgi:Soluble lytic murein transglycosylase and related regulatory proteins (some contain LysM/invasin domains)